MDPSRPFTFHDQCWGSYNNHGSCTQIGNIHYPGPGGPDRAARESRPILFGEYCHVSDYDRSELRTDPGIRDVWGEGFHRMWEKMLAVPACLGGAIWAGIDDVFLMPGGEVKGYGPWGLLDAWRRPKPEYWHAKKVYSPVKVMTRRIEPGVRPIRLDLRNRHLFTNLSEVSILWKLGRRRGRLRAPLAPGRSGSVEIDPGIPAPEGGILEIRFRSPQGFLEDVYRIPVGERRPVPPVRLSDQGLPPPVLAREQDRILVRGKDFLLSLDGRTGRILRASRRGRTVLTGGPDLMILPLEGGPCRPDFQKDIPLRNDLLPSWRAESVRASRSGRDVVVAVRGSFEGARGSYTLRITPGGRIAVDYGFQVTKRVNPRQWGLVFRLPRSSRTLSWERKALWSFYPEDHIGRIRGEAPALPPGPREDPWARKKPHRPWSLDADQAGTRDFRSTKRNILWAALRAPSGEGILLEGEGRLSVRAWLEGGESRLLAAGFTTMGAEGFFASHVRSERRPLEPGDEIRGRFVLDLLGPAR